MAEIKSYIGVGKVLVRPYGSTGKRREVGNVSVVTLTHEVDVQRQPDFQRSGGGTAVRYERLTQINVAMTWLGFSAENWALATAGTATSVPAGSVTTAETIKGYKDSTVQLVHPPSNIDAVTNSGGTTTYAVNTDYVMSGSGLYFPPGSTITEAADLKVTYDYLQYARVEGALGTATELDVLFEGLNEVDSDKPVIVNLWKMSVPSADEIALIGTTLGSMPFQAELIKDSSKGTGVSAYYRALLVGVPVGA